MEKTAKRFTATQVNSIIEPGNYHDGDGLYLQISSAGTKSWIFRFMLGGRARTMGLGGLNKVGLAEARRRHQEAQGLLIEGTDPIEERRHRKANMRLSKASEITFQEAALDCIKVKQVEWRNPKHAMQWRSTLRTYAFPLIGDSPIAEIGTRDVLAVLEPIWFSKTETASRVRGRIEAVLDWAKVHEYRTGDNPARWRGHLDQILPRRSKVATVQHFKALPYTEVGEFIQELRLRRDMAPRALEFAILTGARSGEVRGATWAEMDLTIGIWTVPASRMKAGREHRVPLSSRAQEILKELSDANTCEYVFPNPFDRPLSCNAFRALLHRMKRSDITAHGFRSCLKTWATEQTGYSFEVIEASLAHALQGLEAAYRRTDLLERRRRLMEDWQEYCSRPIAPHQAKVLSIAGLRT